MAPINFLLYSGSIISEKINHLAFLDELVREFEQEPFLIFPSLFYFAFKMSLMYLNAMEVTHGETRALFRGRDLTGP